MNANKYGSVPRGSLVGQDNENIFEPITLNRRDRQCYETNLNPRQNDELVDKSDKKVLSVMMQISHPKDDPIVAKDFDDILEDEDKLDRQKSRKTAGELLDEGEYGDDQIKNFSFNAKNKDGKQELNSPDFLLASTLKDGRRKSFFNVESFGDDSSINNRLSEPLESPSLMGKRQSGERKGAIFNKRNSINEDQMSANFASKVSPTQTLKESSGGNRSHNLQMMKQTGKDLSFRTNENLNSHMMMLMIPDKGQDKSGRQGLSSKIQ